MSLNRFEKSLRQNWLFIFWDFDQNRIRTHTHQFSTDFGARGLHLRHRDCVQQLSRVTDTQKSVKTVWGDQIEWEDPAGTCICVITWRTTETKIKTKRLQMFHKRLVLGLSVCKMYFARTWSPPTPPNSQKWVIEINLTTCNYYMVNSVGIQNSNVSIKTVSEPTEVNFQPIPTFGDSISVTETVFDDHQGSLTLRNTSSFLDDHLWFLMPTRFLMPHRLYVTHFFFYTSRNRVQIQLY